MQQDNFVEEKNEPMPMLCELTTVLQYIVAIAESMALPPSNITFLAIQMLLYGTNTYSGSIFSGNKVYPTYFPIFAQGIESTETAAYW